MNESEEQTTSDIIDATQNAVIDAVNSVSHMIEKQTQESVVQEPSIHESFYMSAEFWVGMAFVLAVVFLFKPAGKALKALLIKRRNNIINTLTEAEDLHQEAQKLVAKYERLILNAPQEIADLHQKAQRELEDYAHEKRDALEKELSKKHLQAQNIIDTTIEQARSEMKSAVAVQTEQIVFSYLKNHLDEESRARLIDDSIQNILAQL